MWRLSPGQDLACRGWDDEFVLYNNLSGDTHLLSAAAMATLSALQQGAAGVPALAAALELEADELPDLSALLDQLTQLQLIIADPC